MTMNNLSIKLQFTAQRRYAMLGAVTCSSHLANWRPVAPGTTNEAPWEEVEACDLGTRERLIIDQ